MYSKGIEEEDIERKLQQLSDRIAEMLESHRRMDRWMVLLEKVQLDDFLYNYTQPMRIIILNLVAGITRGLGFTLGTTLVVAVLVVILRNFVTLPIIGEYIADLIDIIDFHRQNNH
ncbi:conserved hypothetical protein [[Clostridium] ultunense Esp]|uniref:DUF5665 domain-containing protein n=1 Tax=Thermicanus aegyptius TaxID=94009 RepID=UPI0002B70191|nr:DUF5665 domain-containing protein [Thermicanus aegyptius]CCQ92401.1 conserved hypothetical protein [[Clostridium] ultunense Esp]